MVHMGTFTKKMSVLSLCFPCEKILEIQNFFATQFVRLVLAGLRFTFFKTLIALKVKGTGSHDLTECSFRFKN